MPDDLKSALEPGALQKSVESLIAFTPTEPGTQIDVAGSMTEQDTGAEVKLTTSGSWWSAAAWAQWWKTKGWSAGGGGTFKWGGKKRGG